MFTQYTVLYLNNEKPSKIWLTNFFKFVMLEHMCVRVMKKCKLRVLTVVLSTKTCLKGVFKVMKQKCDKPEMV